MFYILKDRTLSWLALFAFGIILLNFFAIASWPITGIVGPTDAGVYVLGGAEWLHGHIPYLEFWDQKPPSIYLLNALALKISGSYWGIWLLSLFGCLVNILLFFDVCRRMYGRTAALPASVFYFFAMLPNTGPDVVNNFLLTLILLSLRILLDRLNSPPRMVLAGFGLGLLWAIAFLFRPNALLLQSVLILLLLLASFNRRGPVYALKALISIAAGAALYLGPMALYFWQHSALLPAYDCLVRFNIVFTGGRFAEHMKALLFGFSLAAGGNTLFLTMAIVWAALRPMKHNTVELNLFERALPVLLIAELFFASASALQYSYYYNFAMLIAGLLICSFISSTVTLLKSIRRQTAKRNTDGNKCSAILRYCHPGTIAFAAKNEPVLAKGFWYDHPVSDIAAFVRKNPGNGNIFVWGNHSNAYLLPGISQTVQYSDVVPFFYANYVSDALVKSLLADLDRAKPAFIFDVSSYDGIPPLSGDGNIAPVSAYAAVEGWESTNRLKPIYAYVAQNYRLVPASQNAKFVVYKRISG